MKIGYARVWTDDQNPALQIAALKKAGCQTLFKDEGISGATTKRPAPLRCLKKLTPGDTLIVWKLDRLGRSLRDLIIAILGSQLSSAQPQQYPVIRRNETRRLQALSSRVTSGTKCPT